MVDPLSLGLYLLLENFGPAVSALAGVDYVKVDPNAQGQRIVDYVAGSAVLAASDRTLVNVEYAGGFTLSLPRYWLDESGHDLVKRLPGVFPYLNRFEHDQGRLLDQVIDRVWASRPGLVPQSTLATLSGILNQ